MSNRKIDPAEIHFDENTAVEVADLENEEYYVEGERLTEESAQRLAAEMLERVRAKNLRPGGKSLSGGNKHSPVVQVRVSERTRDKLQAIADARGMSVSKLSRKVLDEFVKRETLQREALRRASTTPRKARPRRSTDGCRVAVQVIARPGTT